MHVLSVLNKVLPIRQSFSRLGLVNGLQLRNAHDRKFTITASRWQWHKYKDLFHFYFMLGVLPLSALVFFVNIYVGPAQLAEIPEGHYPEKWEFYKHPISRFMAKYFYPSHQEEYEKFIQYMYEEDEKRAMRLIENKAKLLMRYRQDARQGETFTAPTAEYLRSVRKDFDERIEYRTVPRNY